MNRTTGYYTIQSKKGWCLQNLTGNTVNVAKCDAQENAQKWYHDIGKKTVCNMHTRNCLENKGQLSQESKIAAFPDNGSLDKKWDIGPTSKDTYFRNMLSATTPNTRYLSNGDAKISPGFSVAAANGPKMASFTDDDFHMKWDFAPSQCMETKDLSTLNVTPATYKDRKVSGNCYDKCENNNMSFFESTPWKSQNNRPLCTCHKQAPCPKW